MSGDYLLLHSIPGRTRIQVRIPGATPAFIEALFRRIPFVISAVYTKETNSLVLCHDRRTTWKDIWLSLRNHVKTTEHSKTTKNKNQDRASPSFRKYWIHLLVASSVFLLDLILSRGMIRTGLRTLLNLPSLTALLLSRDVIRNGIGSLLKKRRANADTLTTTALLAAVLKGTPRSGLLVMMLSTISEWLTEYAAERTRCSITSMLSLDVPFVWKVGEGGIRRKVPIESIRPGETVAVFTGEKITVDGTVVEGAGAIDESALTGEFLPRDAAESSYVYAGSVLKNGYLHIKVEHAGDDRAITRMIQMIEEAQSRRAPIQNQADKMANSLVPVSFFMAALMFFWTRNWNRVLNMLFIDFACGLKLSTATAISASLGKAAKQGMLIKGGHFLEKLAQMDTVILDKTGTITEGHPEVQTVIPFNGYTDIEVVRYAAAAEAHSSHPIAESMIKIAKHKKLSLPVQETQETIVGRGIKAVIEQHTVIIGSLRFMQESKIDLSCLESTQPTPVQEGDNVVYVALDQKLLGIVKIHDPIREGMKRSINQLRRLGVDEVVMLTGDRLPVARTVAHHLSCDSYHAEALPTDKAEWIRKYRQKGSSVMMVGDGLNDAPALAYADVGVTMGRKRTDLAVEASDVTITSDDPMSLAALVRLSQRTIRVIRQNFLATIVINSCAMLLGAMGRITPFAGAVIHNAATIGVVLNSSKILLWEIR